MFLVSEQRKAGTEEEGEKDESWCRDGTGVMTTSNMLTNKRNALQPMQTHANVPRKHRQLFENAANFCIVTNQHNGPWKHCSDVLEPISAVQNFTFGFLEI